MTPTCSTCVSQTSAQDLIDRLRIKADVMEMGERIAWGSATSLMREAANAIEALQSAQPVAQPLTDKRISWLWSESHNDTTDRMAFQVFARAIEAAHGIKE